METKKENSRRSFMKNVGKGVVLAAVTPTVLKSEANSMLSHDYRAPYLLPEIV